MSPYILFAFGVVAVLAVAVHLHQQRARRRLRAMLREQWGKPKALARDLPLIAAYHHAVASASRRGLDHRTWQDLDLDAVFGFLDRTESVVGRQVLYHRLRSSAGATDTLAKFDELVEALRQDEEMRLDLQTALRALAGNSAHWLWSLALEPIDPLPPWAVVFPAFALTMALLLVLTAALGGPVLVPALVGLLAGGALRAAFGRRLVPLAEPFADMVRLLGVAERAGSLEGLPAGVRRQLTERLPALARLRRSAAWLGRTQGGGAGDLGALVIEYLNLGFCLDANAAMIGARELRKHQQDVHAVFRAIGELDAAISIASVRAGSRTWARPVFAGDEEPAAFSDLAHPLLESPVANSVTLGPPAGLLVTGANMTGKSTFLRTLGVNVVLAQTIDTVFASAYRAPWLALASCIAPTDDLQSGKSYYQAEVETLVAMLADTRSARTHLYLFDELFRGTNTLDRIGAASAVLDYLIGSPASGVRGPESDAQSPKSGVRSPAFDPPGAQYAEESSDATQHSSPVNRRCLVIAATHDLELVTLLSDYAVVHFSDRLTAEGLQFDYLLRPGPTTTRNAIALLGVLGAPARVVSDAISRTDRLRAVGSAASGQQD